MALARMTTTYRSPDRGIVIYDREGSMLAFPCFIDSFLFEDSKPEIRCMKVDIHDFGRAQVMYATSIVRVSDYAKDREPMQEQEQETWIIIQAGV